MKDDVNATSPEIALEDKFVDVSGIPVHYVCAGRGQPLVLVHGLTGSSRNWRHNIDVLARSARVYAIDLPNMGQSGRLHGLDGSLVATADRVLAFLNALGIGRADIAAHSHGGAIAMMLAARHPERVRSLVLFAPANPFSRSGDRLVWFYSTLPGHLLARMVPFMPGWVYRIALGRMYGDTARIRPGCLEGYVDGLKVGGTMEHILRIVHVWHEEMAKLRNELPNLAKVPVLLVWGDRDRAVSLESGMQLHRQLPQSQWAVVTGAGHVPFEEMPEICNGLMLRWLQSLGGSEFCTTSASERRVRQTETRGPIRPTLQGVSSRA